MKRVTLTEKKELLTSLIKGKLGLCNILNERDKVVLKAILKDVNKKK